MADEPRASKAPVQAPQDEQERLLRSLRTHGQVVESDDPDVELGPGQTHVYVKPSGSERGVLLEKRKSLFKRR